MRGGITPQNGLDEWYLAEYARRCLAGVERKFHNRAAEKLGLPQQENKGLGNDVVLPPAEALAFLDTVENDIYLLPCNCRVIAQELQQPPWRLASSFALANTVNFPVDRGWGTKITKEEAKDVLRRCHRGGISFTPWEAMQFATVTAAAAIRFVPPPFWEAKISGQRQSIA